MPDRPSPLVAAAGVVLDTRGRVLVLTTPGRSEPELPGGAVEGAETPEEGLARTLRQGLGLARRAAGCWRWTPGRPARPAAP